MKTLRLIIAVIAVPILLGVCFLVAMMDRVMRKVFILGMVLVASGVHGIIWKFTTGTMLTPFESAVIFFLLLICFKVWEE